jgi:transposase-like protein
MQFAAELSVMEQRYHAVMEVISGAPVTEVARRYGVTRQAVHLWLGKYRREGLAGMADHSHRPLVSAYAWAKRSPSLGVRQP